MPAGVTDASLQANAFKQLVDRLCRSARLEHLAQGPWCQELAVAGIHQHHTGRLDRGDAGLLLDHAVKGQGDLIALKPGVLEDGGQVIQRTPDPPGESSFFLLPALRHFPELTLHFVEALDVRDLEAHGLLSGVAHGEESEGVFGEDVSWRFSHPKACPILRSILLKIEFYEVLRYLRQNMFNVTQYVVMALLEHFGNLQAGDSGNGFAADFLDIDKDFVHIFSTPFESR